VSNALTKGIRVKVVSEYLQGQSDPRRDRFVFMYTVTISNEGKETAQLLTRHWIITDANEIVREVKGDGVIGQQPTLKPGESHEYQSGCILETPWGTMHGSYQFTNEANEKFNAEIAPFLLATPSITSAQTAN